MSVFTQLDNRIRDILMILVWKLYGPLHPYRFKQALIEYVEGYIDAIGNIFQPFIPHHYCIAVSQSIYHQHKQHLQELSHQLQESMTHWIRYKGYRIFSEMVHIQFSPHTTIRKNEFLIQHAGITENDVATEIIPKVWFSEIIGQIVQREKQLLKNGETYVFGRSRTCNIMLNVPHVSRRHFSVTVSASNEILLRILENKNHTVLNGIALPRESAVSVRSGDVLSIGKKRRVKVRFLFSKNYASTGERG